MDILGLIIIFRFWDRGLEMYRGETNTEITGSYSYDIPTREDWLEYERLKRQIREKVKTHGEYEIRIEYLVRKLGI